jgi:hypothetical protein
LKKGLENVRETSGPRGANSTDTLLKSNISSFMDAIKIMKDVHNLSANDKKNDFTKKLEQMIKEILKTAHRIYDQDLASKDRADIIRNSLQILDTYKSLVQFPENVDKYLKDENYEEMLSSYKNANLQLAKIHPNTRKSKLFTQIKTDLDNKCIDVQKAILDKLVQFPSNPDDQKYLIDVFNSLDVLSIEYNHSPIIKNQLQISPAWHCLVEEKKCFIQLMLECRDMHIADEKVSLALKQSNTEDSSSNNNNNTLDANNDSYLITTGHSTNSTNTMTMSASEAAAKIHAMTTVPHERNKFIEELCQMFFDIFSDYWRLSTMYLNNMLTLPEQNTSTTPKGKTGGSGGGSDTFALMKHSPDDVYVLVSEILQTFTNIVRAAFIPHTFNSKKQQKGSDESEDKNKNLFTPWPITHDRHIISQILPHCLRVCRYLDKTLLLLTIY